jgi:hypothetical protein
LKSVNSWNSLTEEITTNSSRINFTMQLGCMKLYVLISYVYGSNSTLNRTNTTQNKIV